MLFLAPNQQCQSTEGLSTEGLRGEGKGEGSCFLALRGWTPLASFTAHELNGTELVGPVTASVQLVMRTIQHHTHITWTYFVLIGYRHSKLDCVVLNTRNPMGMFTLEIANWRSCDMNTRIGIGLHVFRIILLVTQPTKETETGWSPNF